MFGPQCAVWALIREIRGRVLLARRDDESQARNLSGGSIEMMAESAEVAAIREVREEVGLHVQHQVSLGVGRPLVLGVRNWLCGGRTRIAPK